MSICFIIIIAWFVWIVRKESQKLSDKKWKPTKEQKILNTQLKGG